MTYITQGNTDYNGIISRIGNAFFTHCIVPNFIEGHLKTTMKESIYF